MKQNKFPPDWNDKRVKETLIHYESQTEDEAIAEDEAALRLLIKQRWKFLLSLPLRLRKCIARNLVRAY